MATAQLSAIILGSVGVDHQGNLYSLPVAAYMGIPFASSVPYLELPCQHSYSRYLCHSLVTMSALASFSLFHIPLYHRLLAELLTGFLCSPLGGNYHRTVALVLCTLGKATSHGCHKGLLPVCTVPGSAWTMTAVV